MNTSLWQMGVNDARAGLPPNWLRHLNKVEIPAGTQNAHRARGDLKWGYENGYRYGMKNKKAL